MGTLSNLPWLRGFWSPDEQAPVEVRPARGSEIDAGLRLILTSPTGHLEDAQLADFRALATASEDERQGVWVAVQGQRIVSAAMPLISPGRTMLLFTPPAIRTAAQATILRQVVQRVCEMAAEQGVHLAQALMEPDATAHAAALKTCGFERLAELLYMQATISRSVGPPPLPDACRWVTYSDAAHELFARAILATYEQSLDCPALGGLRDIEDILAGHRATGQFDPGMWFVLCNNDQPAAVLLTSALPRCDAVELVYLGIVPAHRGCGVGDLLMRQAAAVVSASPHARLTLAVDAANTPAMRLYWRHGLQAIGRKVAVLRDLRTATQR